MPVNLQKSAAVSPEQLQAPARRDQRVDFLRGLALLLITANHIRGNSLTRWTPLAWGFSDLAEVFVFMSGMVTFLSLQRTDHRSGARGVLFKTWLRVLLIYFCYVLSGTILVLLMRLLGAGLYQWEVSDKLLLCPPSDIPRLVASLRYRVTHLTILPLYLVLLSAAGFLWSVFGRQLKWLPLLSLILYTLTQLFPLIVSYPEPWREALYYNPLAWQILFVAGGGLALIREETRRRFFQSRGAFLSGVVVLACLHGGKFVAQPDWLVSSKQTLGWPRLVHFFALGATVWPLLTKVQCHLNGAIPHLITVCGRHSLFVYCCGALLSATGSWLRIRLGGDLDADILITISAWGFCITLAAIADRVFPKKRSSAAPRHGP